MKVVRGSGRALTDAQVQDILAWYQDYSAWMARRSQLLRQKRQLATELAVSCSTIDLVVARGIDYRVAPVHDRPRGRPATISDPVRRLRVHEWHSEWRQLMASRPPMKTVVHMARAHFVTANTIWFAIRQRGQYKQPSPEKVAEERAKRRARLARLRELNLY